MNNCIEIPSDMDLFWVRTDDEGTVNAAFMERNYPVGQLSPRVRELREVPGPVKRVLASSIILGEKLTLLQRPSLSPYVAALPAPAPESEKSATP